MPIIFSDDNYSITPSMLHRLLPERSDAGNKGTFGTLLALCGSRDMPGAALMAGQAALRCGIGLLALAAPESVRSAASITLPEAVQLPMEVDLEGGMTSAWFDRNVIGYTRATALLFGCGVGQSPGVVGLLDRLLSYDKRPLVIDADGLNLLARHHQTAIGRPAVLTPHVGEMARLTGLSIEEIKAHPFHAARDLARKFDAVVVLKDSVTVIVDPDGRRRMLDHPNSGLAKGGSGDILAGCIAAFLAQGCTPFDAAVLGVGIHSHAGRLARHSRGARGMLPRDVIDQIPNAILDLEEPK